MGVKVVTLWLLSSDNLTNRPPEQMAGAARDHRGRRRVARGHRPLAHPPGGRPRPAPRPAPPQKLKDAEEATRDVDGILVNIAVGYGGRREIADAVRSLLHEHAARGTSLEELADVIDVEHIADHLYTKGQPDPDLVIRTSGEQRLGGFLLWQTRALGVLLLRGAAGPTSAASTSCAPSARTPSASAASAPERAEPSSEPRGWRRAR